MKSKTHNLKNKVFLLLLVTVAGIGKAQIYEFASTGAEWYYEFSQNIAGPMYYVGFEQYAAIGDTVINGQKCKIIKTIGGDSTPCENMGKTSHFLYKEGDQLLWYNEDIGEFTVLHNYAAIQGESWIINESNCSFEVIVDSTSTIRIGEEEKRVLYVHDAYHYYDGCIIEDIGHTSTFFPRDLYWECQEVMCDGINLTNLRCFLNDTWSWHSDTIPCDTTYYGYVNGIPESSNQFSVYPTLVENQFIVRQKGLEIGLGDSYYEIIDIQGFVCKTDNLNGIETIVSINSFSSGIYCLKIFNKKEMLLSIKLIKK